MNIFLCYPSAERTTAEQIRLALMARRHDVFFDRNDLPAGDEYHQRISRAIEQSDAFIFLITPDSVTKGRYTLTELDIAQAKWKHPKGHVLPVMAQPTPIKEVPPYLCAVTILEPQGDVAADVAQGVDRLTASNRWQKILANLKPVLGIGLGLTVLGAAALTLSHSLALKREVADQLSIGRMQAQAEDYASAWATYEQAGKKIHGHLLLRWFGSALVDDLTQARRHLAMEWLDNIRKPSDTKFADIIDPLLPTLDEAIAHTDGSLKGDMLAYRGWADFLRSRDGRGGLKPELFYQRAIEADPSNAYAHAMWGHWIVWTGGSLADADRHFTQALAAVEHRPVVRNLQLAALGNRSSEEFGLALVRVANDMRRGREPLTSSSRERLYRAFDRQFRSDRAAREFAAKLAAVAPPAELLATYQWLFDENEFPLSKQVLAPYLLGLLQAEAGHSQEAIRTLQAFRATLDPHNVYLQPVDEALARLKKSTHIP